EDPAISARDATRKSMDEIQTALIAIAMVLSAVFLPMAFFGGSVGEIYRQFSITMVSAMVLSVFRALVLWPGLAATRLQRPSDAEVAARTTVTVAMHRYGDRFHHGFERLAERYRGWVAQVLDHGRIGTAVYLLLVAMLALAFWILPKSFLPN